jgi:hypothetical protein
VQIAVGAMGGEIASRIIDPDKAHIIGWHPLNPAKSANAIAMSTAAAVGIPQAPSVFLPRPGSPPQGKGSPPLQMTRYPMNCNGSDTRAIAMVQRANGFGGHFFWLWRISAGIGYRTSGGSSLSQCFQEAVVCQLERSL